MMTDKQGTARFFVGSLLESPTKFLSDGWKYAPIYDGPLGGFSKLSIHVSLLEAGILPHEVHSHLDEEIFVILSGALEVISGNQDKKEKNNNPTIEKNGFVYHSRNYQHTLRAAGTSEAHYLVVRWNFGSESDNKIPPFCVTQSQPELIPEGSTDFQIQSVESLEIKTNNRIRAHYSRVMPGGGYEPHKDNYDVLLVLFEGNVETIGVNINAPAVAFFSSGFPHSLKNPGNIPANYIVFEIENQRF